MSDMQPRSGRDDDVLSSGTSTGGASAVKPGDTTRGDHADFDYTDSSGGSGRDGGTSSTSYGTDSLSSSGDQVGLDPGYAPGAEGGGTNNPRRETGPVNEGGGTNNPSYDDTGLGMGSEARRNDGADLTSSGFGASGDTGDGSLPPAYRDPDASSDLDDRLPGDADPQGGTVRALDDRDDTAAVRSDVVDDRSGLGDTRGDGFDRDRDRDTGSGSAIGDLLNNPDANDDATLRGDFDQTNGVLDAFDDRGDGTRTTEEDTGSSRTGY